MSIQDQGMGQVKPDIDLEQGPSPREFCPPPLPTQPSSWKIFRHWVDPTVRGGAFRSCLKCTCQVPFARSIVAFFFTFVAFFFSMGTLLWFKFDVPNGGTAICAGILTASLAVWFKPVRQGQLT